MDSIAWASQYEWQYPVGEAEQQQALAQHQAPVTSKKTEFYAVSRVINSRAGNSGLAFLPVQGQQQHASAYEVHSASVVVLGKRLRAHAACPEHAVASKRR